MGKSKSRNNNSGESRFPITAANLAHKGKTNKKLHLNPQAAKYETAANIKITEDAKAFALAHPKGSGKKYRNKNVTK